MVQSHHRLTEDSSTNAQEADPAVTKLFGTFFCNVASGVCLLAVGVTITGITILAYTSDSRMFMIGPVFLAAGLLSLIRALLSRIKPVRRPVGNSRHQLQSNSSSTNFEPSFPEIPYSSDDPPPYDLVTTGNPNAFVNPLAIEPPNYQSEIVTVSNNEEDDTQSMVPPPTYDDVINNEQVISQPQPYPV